MGPETPCVRGTAPTDDRVLNRVDAFLVAPRDVTTSEPRVRTGALSPIRGILSPCCTRPRRGTGGFRLIFNQSRLLSIHTEATRRIATSAAGPTTPLEGDASKVLDRLTLINAGTPTALLLWRACENLRTNGTSVKVRNIDIDFSTANIFWTPETPEFAQFWNATSTFLPYLEPFLNQAVREGMGTLSSDGSDDQLRDDCRIFMAQEGQHYRNHEKFNKKLRESGYPQLSDREAVMKADYDRYQEKKSLRFRLAYAEGFETLGPILACYFLEAARELQDPTVDDPTADLWRWHLAEEYEHRHVCNYLFHRLYPPHWYRVFGIVYAGRHMLTYMFRTAAYLLREDRRAGQINDPWRSRLRLVGVGGRMLSYALPRLFKSALPSYDPIKIPPPARSMDVLERAETLWPRKRGKPTNPA